MSDDERLDEQMTSAASLATEFDPDQPLFEALRDGDQEVLADIMERHGRWVRGVVFSVVGNAQDVEDVCQHVWLTVWRKADTLNDSRVWRNWLYRTARNASIDMLRKRKRRKNLWQRVVDMTHPADAGTPSQTQKRMVIREDYQAALNAIADLPEIYRQPFVLRHMEGWSYKQIAQAMEMPVDTVETRLVRARRMLRQKLTEGK